MSQFDYKVSQQLAAVDPPFASLIMAALRKADSVNTIRIKAVFPEIAEEFEARYNAPGGLLAGEVARS